MTAVTSSVSSHPRFDAILFDCDGVLVDNEPIVSRLIWEMLIELGIDISLEDFIQRFLGKTIREKLDAVAEMCGAPLPPSWLSTFQTRHNVLLEAEVEAVPHIRHAIDVLSRLDLPIAVASGADCMKMKLRLGRAGLIEYFQPTNVRIFSATEVARNKPAPGVCLLAASSLGVSPSHYLVIENSPTGITAGYAAGITVLTYTGRNASNPLVVAGATHTFTDMRELPELLV